MSDLPASVAEQLRAYSLVEAIAVLTAIGYLLLAIRQNIWCWGCAAISTILYVYLFIDARLYMESVLNVFYLGMAAYGWYSWRYGGDDRHDMPVTVWPAARHGVAIMTIAAIAAANGFLLDRYTTAAFPYVDSLTTWGAIWTTFLVARKVLENWFYWFVIDAASVVIYWLRDLELTALLFVVYLIMIPFGWLSWRRSMAAA